MARIEGFGRAIIRQMISYRPYLRFRYRCWKAGRPAPGELQVSYGHERIPALEDSVYGGIVKFQRLAEHFKHSPYRFNLLYLGSSVLPPHWRILMKHIEQGRTRLIWNQNGVAYPGCYGSQFERINAPMRAFLRLADYVIYQSEFCRLSADQYLGAPQGPSEVLYNCVDTRIFTPPPNPPPKDQFVMVLGGTQYERQRLFVAIETLCLVRREIPRARLLVAGRLWWMQDEQRAATEARQLCVRHGVADHVEFHGTYTQKDAPALLGRGHLLLHTKYNDPCPSLVVEALACGLPVAYSRSGGVPELVGDEAGVGVEAPLSWEKQYFPAPELLAKAVIQIASNREVFAEAARRRAVERFDLAPFVTRHGEIFERWGRAKL